MQLGDIGCQRRQPGRANLARMGVDQEGGAHLDDDAAKIFERGAFHGCGRTMRMVGKQYAPVPAFGSGAAGGGLSLHQPCGGVTGAHGSCPLLAFSETGASPITSTSALSASGTPSPVAADSNSGGCFSARFWRSRCFFNSSDVTASILFSATISILSARCPS